MKFAIVPAHPNSSRIGRLPLCLVNQVKSGMGHGLVHVPLILLFPVLGVTAKVQLVHWIVAMAHDHEVPCVARASAHVFRSSQQLCYSPGEFRSLKYSSRHFQRHFVFDSSHPNSSKLSSRKRVSTAPDLVLALYFKAYVLEGLSYLVLVTCTAST